MTLFVVSALTAIMLTLAYWPPIAETAGFRYPWVAIGLTWIAGSLTRTAWRHECKGPTGAACTLLDNVFYSAAIAFAAMNTNGNVAIALALVHGLILALFPGQLYAFSTLLAAAMSLPLIVLLAIFQPPLSITLITIGSMTSMLVLTLITRNRRYAERRQRHLKEALDVTRELADESVQAALTTTLLTLGHFVHELVNWQTAVSTNLEYVDLRSNLDPDAAKALTDARAAQEEQHRLLRSTIEDLKSRARPTQSHFTVLDTLTAVAQSSRFPKVKVLGPTLWFEVLGNPEHLRVVLLNLVRNAEDADARTVTLEQHLDPGGMSMTLIVSNDGDPIPEELHSNLFNWFVDSSKPGGSGLGLYLCRRYAQLLGGDISVKNGRLGGPAFSIRLPGKLKGETTNSRHPSGARPIAQTSKTA